MPENIDIYQKILKASRENVLKRAMNTVSNIKIFKSYSSNDLEKSEECIKNIINAKRYFDKKLENDDDFKNLNLLDEELLKTLDTKELVKLSEVITSMRQLQKTIIEQRNNPLSKDAVDQMKNALEICKDAVNDISDTFVGKSIIKEFGIDELNNVLAQIDRGDPISNNNAMPSNADMEVVAALKLVGVDLDYKEVEKDGKRVYEWALPKGEIYNEFAMRSANGREAMSFTADQVQGLLDNYLNKSEAERNGQVITADGLMKVFMQEVNKQVDGMEGDKLLKDQVKLSLISQQKKFSSNSDEYQLALLTDKNTIMKLAQKQSLIEVFNSQCEKVSRLNLNENFSSEIYEDIEQNSVLEGKFSYNNDSNKSNSKEERMKKKLYSLENLADAANEYIEDKTCLNRTENMISQYDKLISRLEIRKNEPGMSENLIALKKARNMYIANVQFQRDYIEQQIEQQKGNGIITKQAILGFSQEASQFTVERQSNGEINLVDMGSTNEKANNVIQFIRQKAERSKENKNTNSTNGSQQELQIEQALKKSMPNIFMNYSGVITNIEGLGQDYVNIMDSTMSANIAGFLFRPDQPLDIAYREFIAKNKDKTIDDFIQRYTQSEAGNLLNAEALKAGFLMNNPEAGKMKYADGSTPEDKRNKFIKQLVLLDLATQGLSAEEVQQYLSKGFPEESRNHLLASKITDATKIVNNMKPEEYAKAADLAQKRLEHGVMKQYLSAMMPAIIEAENEKGNGLNLTKALHSYVQELGRQQDKNNEVLLANGEKIVDPKLTVVKEQENEQENKQEDEWEIYDKIYPSSPSNEKFLKKMKPYHGKEIIKYFLEPLLEDISKIKINMTKYKENTESYEPTPFIQDQQRKNKENKENQQSTIEIKQRNFEAATFMPGYFMLQSLAQDDNYKDNPAVKGLLNTFGYMCSTDEVKDNILCKKKENGKDFRDEMRQVAIDICGGKYKDDPTKISETIKNSAQEYNIPADNPKLVEILNSFEMMTPELLDYVFMYCSETDEKSKTIKVGSNLPFEELSKASSDKERENIMSNFYLINSRKMNNKEDENLLGMLLSEYYTENGKINQEELKKAFSNNNNPTGATFEQLMEKLKEDEGRDM